MLAAAGTSGAEGAVFRLCASSVAAVSLVGEDRGAVVQVQLTADASNEFEQLSRALEGRMLVVFAGEAVFSRAVVQAPIGSGRLRSPVVSKMQAASLRQEVMIRRPPEECGHLANS